MYEYTERRDMLEAYSTNAAVAANAAIPFNNVVIQKGNTAVLSGAQTIELNKCGVYMVELDGTASASTTVQMTKNGVAQPQAQSTGTTFGFQTLVQVPRSNTSCCCSSPTLIQFTADAAVTLTNVNVVVTKVC